MMVHDLLYVWGIVMFGIGLFVMLTIVLVMVKEPIDDLEVDQVAKVFCWGMGIATLGLIIGAVLE